MANATKPDALESKPGNLLERLRSLWARRDFNHKGILGLIIADLEAERRATPNLLAIAAALIESGVVFPERPDPVEYVRQALLGRVIVPHDGGCD